MRVIDRNPRLLCASSLLIFSSCMCLFFLLSCIRSVIIPGLSLRSRLFFFCLIVLSYPPLIVLSLLSHSASSPLLSFGHPYPSPCYVKSCSFLHAVSHGVFSSSCATIFFVCLAILSVVFVILSALFAILSVQFAILSGVVVLTGVFCVSPSLFIPSIYLSLFSLSLSFSLLSSILLSQSWCVQWCSKATTICHSLCCVCHLLCCVCHSYWCCSSYCVFTFPVDSLHLFLSLLSLSPPFSSLSHGVLSGAQRLSPFPQTRQSLHRVFSM